jgi:hypothetical protein
MAVAARLINALSVRQRKTVSLSGVQPQFPVHSRPGNEGEEERFSDIKK